MCASERRETAVCGDSWTNVLSPERVNGKCCAAARTWSWKYHIIVIIIVVKHVCGKARAYNTAAYRPARRLHREPRDAHDPTNRRVSVTWIAAAAAGTTSSTTLRPRSPRWRGPARASQCDKHDAHPHALFVSCGEYYFARGCDTCAVTCTTDDGAPFKVKTQSADRK